MPMPCVTCIAPEKAPEPRPHTPSHISTASPARCRGVEAAMDDGPSARVALPLLSEAVLGVYDTCPCPMSPA